MRRGSYRQSHVKINLFHEILCDVQSYFLVCVVSHLKLIKTRDEGKKNILDENNAITYQNLFCMEMSVCVFRDEFFDGFCDILIDKVFRMILLI